LKWSNLRIKKNKDKKIAVTIFSFPTDKGNVGTAAYLDVLDSTKAVLQQFKRGYNARDTVSYLTPPAENAGLYKGLKELKELISSYQGLR
jgi:cobalamin biosynthesis Mg chelatase CobN